MGPLILLSRRSSQIQLGFLERIRKGQNGEEMSGVAQNEVGRKWRCCRKRRRMAGEERESRAGRAYGGNFPLSAAASPSPGTAPPPHPPPPPPQPSPTPAMWMCQEGGAGHLWNLSVLSEMSAEINLANPPRWPVTLISLKFQAD